MILKVSMLLGPCGAVKILTKHKSSRLEGSSINTHIYLETKTRGTFVFYSTGFSGRSSKKVAVRTAPLALADTREK